jgi:hypothetical protein
MSSLLTLRRPRGTRGPRRVYFNMQYKRPSLEAPSAIAGLALQDED